MFFVNEMPTPFFNDPLKKKLREVEGIPKADYVVENERVFVFNVLVERVRELSSQSPLSRTIDEIAQQALPNAWVSPIEALSRWGIVPVPYEKVESQGQLAILHKPFNALLPNRYAEEGDRDRDLAKLLLGQIVEGEGDFVFAGQPMNLRQSLNPNLLPPRPVFEELDELERFEIEPSFTYLSRLTYEPGFDPLSKDWFDCIKNLKYEWISFNDRIKPLICSNLQLIWSRTEEIDWTQWNELVTEEEVREDLTKLRMSFPELNAMPDGALYGLFDKYQLDCWNFKRWSVYREEGFFFFLLGQLSVSRSTDGKEAFDAGEFVGYELLRGQSLSESIEAGKAWLVYDKAIDSLAHKVSEIIEFLCNRPDVRKGKPIVVFQDWFALARKIRSEVVTVEQSIEDLT